MDQLIQFIIYIVIFATFVWGAFWICGKAGAPQPVLWIVGAFFLIILLLGANRFLGSGVSFKLFN